MVVQLAYRLLSASLLILCASQAWAHSSMKARINRPAFEFFSKQGHYLVDAEIPKIPIPNITIPINDGPGNGSVTASNFRISKFKTPNINFDLKDDGIYWTSSGGAIKIEGNWAAEYAVLIPFYEDGWVQAIAVGLDVHLGASVYTLDQKPQLKLLACDAQIEDLHIEIGGGVLPWLINLFREPLSAELRKIINKQACVAAGTLFLSQANEFLHSLPTHVPIGHDFYVDYSIDGDPIFTPDYVEAYMSASVVYQDMKCAYEPDEDWSDPGSNPGMITFWMSESVPNCFLQSAHRGQLVHFLVTKDLPELEKYLKTSCSMLSVCIGKFFPELRKKYPDSYVDLYFHTYEDPSFVFEKGDARANITFAVDIHINPMKQNPKPLARLVLRSSSSVIPQIVGHKIVGSLNDTEVELKEEFSTIGNMSSTFLGVFNSVFKMTTKMLMDTILKTGIPIPVFDNVTIANNSEITLYDKFMRLNVNFELE